MKNYYTNENMEILKNALTTAKEEIKAGKINSVSISKGNVKMGAVPSVSTLPFITCPARCKGTCGKECYAAKIALLRKSILVSYARNTALYMLKPDLFWAGVEYAIKGARFFRFHVSGDIVNREYFENMVAIAKRNEHCQILAFTKRFEVVNAWTNENGDLPENLHILFSGWENMTTVNPHNIPETNVFDKKVGPAESWLVCGGNCFNCACRGVGCWQAKKGDVIAFAKH